MRRFADAGDDRGSMMLALLLMMTTLALGSILVATSVGQATTVRHDQKFTQVLPAGDAAIQRGLFMLNNGGASAYCSTTVAPLCLPSSTAQSALTQGTQTANWYSTPVANAAAPPSYLLTATTTGIRRTLVAEAYQSKRFGLGAFADQSFVMRGGNGSNSYNSASGGTITTGHGRIGSNGSVSINGNGTADGVDLYDWTRNPNASRCSGSPCSSLATYPDPYDITSPSSYAFITAQLAACGAVGGFQSSTAPSHMLPAGTWCASSLNFDADTTVTGPTVIFVSGAITAGHHLNINFTSGLAPVPANLQIYSLGPSVDLSNHTNIGAAIYAPLASCDGGAQVNVYGSLVCRSISNVGGWQFHYDDALALVGAGDFRLRHYREQ
jgi:hypothetical protein